MADYNYLTQTGVIVPDTSTILTDVQNEYKDVFGSDLVVTADTPQGVLITAEALARARVANNNAAIANQINPNIAGGTFLDAIMALSGMQRTPATKTLVPNVALTGVSGTLIPAGSQAQTGAGDVFEAASSVILDGSGNATVDFYSAEFGPIPCNSGALTQIVSSILGWETVTNSSGGTPGQNTQSDQAARALRNNTLAFQGVSLAEAITSALYATQGVTSLSFRENYNNSPMGIIIGVTNGTTLSGKRFGMTTTGIITVGTTAMNFAETLQVVPSVNPWPTAKYSTTGNVTLSGLATQGGGDWPGAMTAGDIVLVKDNTAAAENGIWVAAAGAWARHAYNVAASVILGSNDGISMIKNSVYACVKGGTNADVAAALLENKSSGAAWNGNTSVDVVEPASGQTYTVKFDRPATVNILVKVTTTNGDVNNINKAIVDYANGNINGMVGFIVGADVSPFEIAGAITAENPGYYISKVEISYDTPVSWTTDVIPIGLNQQAYTQASFVTVIIS